MGAGTGWSERAHALRTVLFPRPRIAVSRRELWVPLALIAGFAGAAVALDLAGLVLFTRPLALVALGLIGWIWWIGRVGGTGGLPPWRRRAALFVRCLLVALFAALLAEPRAVRTSDEVAVIYVLDYSDSMPEERHEDALAWVLKSAVQRGENRVGLVVFGRDAAVELPPRQTFPFGGSGGRDVLGINSQIARDATDIERALTLAAAMLPEGLAGRLVLISDGVATSGRTERATEELKARGIPVDVLSVGYHYGEEVWVERIDLPRRIDRGDPFEGSVIIGSLTPGKGELIVRQNDREVVRTPIEYKPPKKRVRIKLDPIEPGYYEYSAVIKVDDGADRRRENNLAVGHVYRSGNGRVLVAVDPGGEELDRTHLVEALKMSERSVDVVESHGVPRDALSLLPYDLVVLCNVPRDQLDPAQIAAIHDAVENQGTGLLMVGGRNSFGPGGWHRTPIEKALPVDMDVKNKKVLPKSALAIILHTCEFPEGNTWGKRITKRAIKVLGARDDVGVLIYGGSAAGWTDRWLFTLQPAGNYPKLAKLINGADIADMPSFVPTMNLAFTGLKANDAAAKHVIIISDGDPTPPPPVLLQQYVDEKITVSTVTIHPHGGRDTETMKRIAEITKGRHYFPKSANQLPAIFIKEAKTLKRSMVQKRTFVPERASGTSEILKGIDRVPPLHAYVLSTPKESPHVDLVLVAPSREDAPAEEQSIDPILATWRYGLGKTAAWTSDLTANWARDWVTWDHYRAFVHQLVKDISRVERPSDLELRATPVGGSALIEVNDASKTPRMLALKCQLSGPRNRSVSVPLEPVGPGRYRARVPMWGTGRYQVAATTTGLRVSEQAFGGFAVPYSAEYLRFRSDPIALTAIAEATGGRELDAEDHGAVFERFEAPRKASRPIAPWLLVALAIAVVLDVGLRRVQLDWLVIKGWFVGSEERTETMSTLLAAKERIKRREGPLPADLPPLEAVPPGEPARPAASPRGEAEARPEEQAPPESSSTTGHLLAMKRKRQRRKDDEE